MSVMVIAVISEMVVWCGFGGTHDRSLPYEVVFALWIFLSRLPKSIVQLQNVVPLYSRITLQLLKVKA